MRASVPTVLYYITGHGFGHATRSLTVIARLLADHPRTRIVVRSPVPAWFLSHSGPPGVELQAMTPDTGVVQVDAMAIDEQATAARARDFYATFDRRVHEEADAIGALRPSVVVGDIPALAFAAARQAGVPSVAVANFTWDWIYQAYPRFETVAPGVTATIGDAYAAATVALRLPFAGGFDTMRQVTRDIPLVARQSRLGRDAARRRLQLGGERPVVLASFGGHRTLVPYAHIATTNRLTLLLTDHEQADAPPHPHVRCVTADQLHRLDLRYEDLVAAADVVVSKPGYGIVSECIANDTALLYTSRGHFAENAVMVSAMGDVARVRFIEQDVLRAGVWEASIEALLAQPAPARQMPAHGAAVAAAAIADLL